MFDLSDKIIEQIVFAMEDQERKTVVDLETGEVLPASGRKDGHYADPPSWSSREGFKLMEDFLSSVRQPSARRELSAALGRGRGVFRAFKAVLAQHEDLERAFRDFKIKAMRRSIVAWYDDQREALGLERMGPEPEDTQELIASDLNIEIANFASVQGRINPLLDEAEKESLEYLPSSIAAFEFDRLRDEIESAGTALTALADDGEGGALGAAIAVREALGERAFGRILFCFVSREFRRMGMGKALLDSLASQLRSEGISLITIDSAFLPPEMSSALNSIGYAPYGIRALSKID